MHPSCGGGGGGGGGGGVPKGGSKGGLVPIGFRVKPRVGVRRPSPNLRACGDPRSRRDYAGVLASRNKDPFFYFVQVERPNVRAHAAESALLPVGGGFSSVDSVVKFRSAQARPTSARDPMAPASTKGSEVPSAPSFHCACTLSQPIVRIDHPELSGDRNPDTTSALPGGTAGRSTNGAAGLGYWHVRAGDVADGAEVVADDRGADGGADGSSWVWWAGPLLRPGV